MLPEPRTAAGRAGLATLTADPAAAVLAIDYDGTLAPIVARPEDAVPAPGAVEALAACATTYGTVAIVTGRPAEVVVGLGGLAQVEGLVVLGHYGEERWTAATGVVRPPEPSGLAAARATLPERLASVAGASIEDKGLSLAVHTRRADNPSAALAAATEVVHAIAAETGLAVAFGRYVVELRGTTAADKRTAIDGLVAERRPRALLFAGDDDLVDKPGFEAVEAFRAAGGAGVGVFVDNEEAGGVRETADLVLPSPVAFVAFLRALA